MFQEFLQVVHIIMEPWGTGGWLFLWRRDIELIFLLTAKLKTGRTFTIPRRANEMSHTITAQQDVKFSVWKKIGSKSLCFDGSGTTFIRRWQIMILTIWTRQDTHLSLHTEWGKLRSRKIYHWASRETCSMHNTLGGESVWIQAHFDFLISKDRFDSSL